MVNVKLTLLTVFIWRQQAENLANWAKKGALIGIYRSYSDLATI